MGALAVRPPRSASTPPTPRQRWPPARRLGRAGHRGRGPGAGRQVAGRDRGVPRPRAHRVPRASRDPGPLRRRAADVVGGVPRAAAAGTAPTTPAPSGLDGEGAARRLGDPDLHLRHDRAAEGRDAQRHQRRVRHQGARRRGRLHRPTARAGRPAAVLPSPLPRRRADLHAPGSTPAAAPRSTSRSRSRRCRANLREVQPTVLFGVPRIWEKLLAGVEIATLRCELVQAA